MTQYNRAENAEVVAMTTDRYHLGEYAPSVSRVAAQLDGNRVPARLRAHDHTLWNDDPAEIINRLAWLTLPTDSREKIGELVEFATEVRDARYRYVALLGMGGSSLGPEVIRQIVGSPASGHYPQMLTLDSTVPAWVSSATAAIDPALTIFVLSSKSGTTTEPLTFYAHFRNLVEGCVGAERAGDNFIAITDPDTALAKLAQSDGFRRAFINDPDIGGRYSVLSYFGLLPAALTGVDLARLLEPAAAMQRRCLSLGPVADNPGAWLGTVIGTLAREGRDKLTLVASPKIAGFGLWVEQLLAESTGKNGTGIIPVAAEPLAASDSYGPDRLFVQLRLANDDSSEARAADQAMSLLGSAGHPTVRLELSGAYDLGAEFYRWEYATAIAGHILGIHPFDQPDVQGAKDRTVSVLEGYQAAGRLPDTPSDDAGRLLELLAQSGPGDYLAIMAYLPDADGIDDAICELRRRVMGKRRIATTAGYGPRFLHSTGQLHKGGPDSGIFLQLTQEHAADLDIPGWPFSFGTLADAQALGDLQALRNLGRRAVSIRLDGNPADAIRRLADML